MKEVEIYTDGACSGNPGKGGFGVVMKYKDTEREGWLDSWQSRGWKKADGTPALNVDLWSVLTEQLKIHDVEFIWVKGHNNNPYNERCDRLAVAAYGGENLIEDPGAKE